MEPVFCSNEGFPRQPRKDRHDIKKDAFDAWRDHMRSIPSFGFLGAALAVAALAQAGTDNRPAGRFDDRIGKRKERV